MDDRTMLTLAAKAAGIEVAGPVEKYIAQPRREHEGGFLVRNRQGGDSGWNPLTDDGDALRLAVKLHIDIEFNNGTVKAIWVDLSMSETHTVLERCDESFEGWDAKHAATRRAIVRAAAEVGRKS